MDYELMIYIAVTVLTVAVSSVLTTWWISDLGASAWAVGQYGAGSTDYRYIGQVRSRKRLTYAVLWFIPVFVMFACLMSPVIGIIFDKFCTL